MEKLTSMGRLAAETAHTLSALLAAILLRMRMLKDYIQESSKRKNVCELETLVEGIMATHQGQEVIREKDIRPYLYPDLVQKGGETSVVDLSMFSLQRLEKYAIEQVLRLSGNNKSRASEILGISRETLYRKMRHYAIPL